MLEKIKQFFAGIASVTIALYAIGFIAEYAHAKMLGIAMVDPVPEYYLISGGTFFLSTLLAIYFTLLNYWYYYVLFLIAAGAFVYFDQYEQNETRLGLLSVYTGLVVVIICVYLIVVISLFTTPMHYKDFLLRGFEPITQGGFFTGIEKELRTWILNENSINVDKMQAFYTLLIFFTAFAALVTYALVRRGQKGGWDRRPKRPFSKLWYDIQQGIVPIFIAFMGTITVILIVLIPIDFGVLLKSNTYPEVKVTLAEGVEFMPEREPGQESKLWLLRENRDEYLFHVIYVEKGKSKPVFKILVVKKGQVKTVEILKKSFILKIK